MNPGQLIFRGVALLGLVAVFVLVAERAGGLQDYRQASSVQTHPTVTPAPSPTSTVLPTPTAAHSPTLLYSATTLPPQDQVCEGIEPTPPLTEIGLLSSQGDVVVRIYCEGPDLKYVISLDYNGMVDRTYLFEDGKLRVKLYHADGSVVNRVDFDEEGNLVPDRTYIKLPNSRIGPGL